MDEILREFIDDVESIRQSVILLEQLKKLNTMNEAIDFEEVEEEKKNCLVTLTSQTKNYYSYFPVMEGTLVLYVSGRFEYYVRSIFEDACEGISGRCGTYETLPKEMKTNLIKYTAEVISSPRKYNHGEGAVKTFVNNLAQNLYMNNVSAINTQCLSITNENMRASTMQDLFDRCGIKKLWESLAEQAVLKQHFASIDRGIVESSAKSKLDELMTLRNNIAHPASDITWPDANKIGDYVDYLVALSKALKDVIQVHVLASGNK